MKDEHLEGETIIKEEPPVLDEHLDYIVLFADALDPDTETTVEQRKAEWEELFNETTQPA